MEEGADYIDQAVELDPNLAAAWSWGGYARMYVGREGAVDHFERALRLNPLDPAIHATLNGLAHAHCIAGHYDEAAAWAEKALRRFPTFPPPYWALIVSNVLAGRIDKAKQAWARYQQVDPTARISNVQTRMGSVVQETLFKYGEALRIVGMPE
jgi:tetratricopeptide (TPR) repeat protein